jgi:hypothetical protein
MHGATIKILTSIFFSIILMELMFNSVDKFAFHVKSSTILICGGSVLMCYGKLNDCNNTCKKTRKSCREILDVYWILIFVTLNNRGSSGGVMTKPPNFFPGEGKIFFFRSVQTACGNHPVSYPLGTGRISPPGKVTAATSWPLTSIWCWG